MSIDLDPDDFEAFNEEAVSELESVFEEATPDPWGDTDLDPDAIVTEDDLEDQLSDIAGISEEDAEEIAQQYALGGLHHIVEGDCEHEEHQRIREALGLEEGAGGEEADPGDADGDSGDDPGDAGGGEGGEAEGEGESSSESEESDESESEPSEWDGDVYDTEEESPWGKA